MGHKMLQKLVIIFLCNLFSLASLGELDDRQELVNYLRSALPLKLRSIFPGFSKLSDVKKVLGIPKKKRQNLYFYELGHRKYDTTVSIKNKIVDYIVYQFKTDSLIKLSDLSKWISQKQIDKEVLGQKINHESGRDFEINLPRHRISIVVSRNSIKRIKSVAFFSK